MMRKDYEIWWMYEYKPSLKGCKTFIRKPFKEWKKHKYFDINLRELKKFVETKYPDLEVTWTIDRSKTKEIYIMTRKTY